MTGVSIRRAAFAALVLASVPAAPAWAGSGISIPEPTDVTLIALALAGLLIGRRGGKRPPEE